MDIAECLWLDVSRRAQQPQMVLQLDAALAHVGTLAGRRFGDDATSWKLPARPGQPDELITLHDSSSARRHTGELRLPVRWCSP